MRSFLLAVPVFACLLACEEDVVTPEFATSPILGIGQCVAISQLQPRAITCTGQSYGGRAVGVQTALVALGDTGELPQAGGSLSKSLPTINVLGLLSGGAVSSSVSTEGTSTNASASVAGLRLSVLGIGISADELTSTTSAACGSTTSISVVSGLRIGGATIAITGAPNQVVTSGLVRVVINEQSNGTTRALHVTALGVDVIVASSRASVQYTCIETEDPPVDPPPTTEPPTSEPPPPPPPTTEPPPAAPPTTEPPPAPPPTSGPPPSNPPPSTPPTSNPPPAPPPTSGPPPSNPPPAPPPTSGPPPSNPPPSAPPPSNPPASVPPSGPPPSNPPGNPPPTSNPPPPAPPASSSAPPPASQSGTGSVPINSATGGAGAICDDRNPCAPGYRCKR